MTPYDNGYSSSIAWATVHEWQAPLLTLNIGWITAKLKIDPHDEFQWGCFDALCDLLAKYGVVRLDEIT